MEIKFRELTLCFFDKKTIFVREISILRMKMSKKKWKKSNESFHSNFQSYVQRAHRISHVGHDNCDAMGEFDAWLYN